MLINGRVDIVSLSKTAVNELTESYPDIKLRELNINIPPIKLYHYLHKKHQSMMLFITLSLEKLEASGFISDAILRHQQLFIK